MSQRTWSSLVSLGVLSLALGGFLLACGGQQKPKEQLNAEMKSLGARAARGGIFLTILVVLIVSLMAGKPAI